MSARNSAKLSRPHRAGLLASLLILLLAAAMGITARPAQAAAQINVWEHFSISETTCSGDTVVIDGRVHFLATYRESASGNVITGLHLNSVSALATSDSGEKYLLRDGSKTTTKNAYLPDPESAGVWTSTIRLRFIQTGESIRADDLAFKALFHLTWNASDKLIVEIERVEPFECR